MEDVLEVYARPYDPKRPVVCVDESAKEKVPKRRCQRVKNSPYEVGV